MVTELCHQHDLAAADAFNGIFKKAVYDYFVSCYLARHFHEAGLKDIETEAFLAHTNNLDKPPCWRAFIVSQMPMFVHAGLIEVATAQAFLADIEEINSRGEFSEDALLGSKSHPGNLKLLKAGRESSRQ